MVDFSAMSLDEIERYIATAPFDERKGLTELAEGLLDSRPWAPLGGPQSMAYSSEAKVVGYGGAAGGGKTDLMCGTALTKHTKSLILRREATQLQGIYDRIGEIVGNRDGFNRQDKIWRLDGGKQIEFGSVPHLGDWMNYQGRPHDFLGFDEATNFLEAQVRALLGWLRTTDPNQPVKALLTFNPPTTSDGQWVIPFFAPWLDKGHPNRAAPGEIRHFAMVNGKEEEVPDGRNFVFFGKQRVYDYDPADFKPTEIIKPMSRTFIPSSVEDNPYLTETDYIATLQGMPEPLRSQMLKGDFLAGMEDDAYQLIPSSWVQYAMDRWQPRDRKGTMDSMGVDIARGGRDEMQIARRHGTWFDTLIGIPGDQVGTGPLAATQVLVHRRDRAPVHLDIIGVGGSPFDFLIENQVQTIGINGAAKSYGRTTEGNLAFVNQRAEFWWRMREALNPLNPEPIYLPKDEKLKADLTTPKWLLKSNGIQVESKEEIIKRLGRSPDRGDAVVYALIDTPRDEDVETFMADHRQKTYDRYEELPGYQAADYDRYRE